MSENRGLTRLSLIFGQLFTYLKKNFLHWNSKSECYNSQIICTKNFIQFLLQDKKLSRLQNPNFVIFSKKMSPLRKSPHMYQLSTVLGIFEPSTFVYPRGSATVNMFSISNFSLEKVWLRNTLPTCSLDIWGDFLSHNIFLLKMTKLGFCNRDNFLSCNKNFMKFFVHNIWEL